MKVINNRLALVLLVVGILTSRPLMGAPLNNAAGATESAETQADTLLADGDMSTPQQAAALEQKLAGRPKDLDSRIKLLGYYFAHYNKLRPVDAFHAKWRTELFWIIENRPDAAVFWCAQTWPLNDRPTYDEGAGLWLAQIGRNPANAAILANAAGFFQLYDPPRSEGLLDQAEALDPSNPVWPYRMSQLFTTRMDRLAGQARVEAAKQAFIALKQVRRLAAASNVGGQFTGLFNDLPRLAYEAGQYGEARNIARHMVNDASKHLTINGLDFGDGLKGDEYYDGNMVLGLVALQAGDLAHARSYLLASGKTTGSPPLDSFGPNMMLAKALLEKGDKQTVLQFFKECASFWRYSPLDKWSAQVEAGTVPDFGPNLDY